MNVGDVLAIWAYWDTAWVRLGKHWHTPKSTQSKKFYFFKMYLSGQMAGIITTNLCVVIYQVVEDLANTKGCKLQTIPQKFTKVLPKDVAQKHWQSCPQRSNQILSTYPNDGSSQSGEPGGSGGPNGPVGPVGPDFPDSLHDPYGLYDPDSFYGTNGPWSSWIRTPDCSDWPDGPNGPVDPWGGGAAVYFLGKFCILLGVILYILWAALIVTSPKDTTHTETTLQKI